MNTLKKIILAATMATGAFLVYNHLDYFSVDERLLTSEQVKTNLAAREKLTNQEHRQARKYAVVINGDRSPLHKGNVTEAYHLLIKAGYDENNIFLLTSNFPDERNSSSITTLATKDNVDTIFNYLEALIDGNDRLVVYTTGHGDDSGKDIGLVLDDGEIPIPQLGYFLKRTTARDYIIIADQCYSGALVDLAATLDKRVIALSSTDALHTTLCESFIRPFFDSFKSLKYDLNSDGIIELDEAFKNACERHKEKRGDSCREFHSLEYPATF